jgi:carnitine 3-dehydrogenase
MKRPAAKNAKTIACVGGGYIGAGWAAYFLAQGKDVVLSDPGPDAEAKARVIIDQAWPYLKKLGLAKGASKKRFRFAGSVAEAVADADFVQESAPDREDLKIALFAEMDAHARPDTILASSSSAFLPSRLQSRCKHPDRVVIGHPFAPSYLVPLVEVVGGKKTSRQAMQWAFDFYESIGKKAMKLNKEIESYVANRIQHVVFEEAASLVDQGICTYDDIDTAVAYGPGMRWAFAGPSTCYHLGGGKGGIRHMIDHFGWKRGPKAKKALIGSIDGRYGHLDMAELEAWRDDNLLAIMKGLKAVPAKKSGAAKKAAPAKKPAAKKKAAAKKSTTKKKA